MIGWKPESLIVFGSTFPKTEGNTILAYLAWLLKRRHVEIGERDIFAAGKTADDTYKTIGYVEDVKVSSSVKLEAWTDGRVTFRNRLYKAQTGGAFYGMRIPCERENASSETDS